MARHEARHELRRTTRPIGSWMAYVKADDGVWVDPVAVRDLAYSDGDAPEEAVLRDLESGHVVDELPADVKPYRR